MRRIELTHWALNVASVPVADKGSMGKLLLAADGVLDAWLSFAGADTMTVRVEVDVRPAGSVTT